MKNNKKIVLAVVALGVPAVYFWTFFHSLSLQIKKMGLPRPFYRLLLDDEGLSVWMAGEQDKPEASRKYAWHDLHLAYRTPNAIYLYVQQNQAYLLNDSLDAAWSLLQASLPAERLHDMRYERQKPIAQLCDGLFCVSKQKQAAPWKGGESGAACV